MPPTSIAKAHVKSVQDSLPKGEAFDSHRVLLTLAHDSTNGSAGSVESLSQLVSMLAAVTVKDRVGEAERVAAQFAELHGSCPLKGADVPALRKLVAKPPQTGSLFSLSKDGLKASGPVAFAAILVVLLLGSLWILKASQSQLEKSLQDVRREVKTLAIQPQQD